MQNTGFINSTLRITRNNLLKVLAPFTNEQLNTIPPGLNNNLIWNFGHVIVTHQLLCYKLAGEEMKIENELVAKYRKGTKPEGIISDKEITLLKGYALDLVDHFERDLQTDKFQNYKPYGTSYGVELSDIQQATLFNNIHEGMHLGTMLAMRNLV